MDIKGIKSIFSSTDKRNIILRNNIILSTLFKFIGLATSLLIVPITLHYLNNEIYGIWLTLTSILYWFSFFDIGLGNGMRNYLTKAISNGNYEEGRAYLSTTLGILVLIAIGISVLCVIPLSILNFNKLFNSYSISNDILRNLTIIAVLFTLANFVVKNIGYVFVAMQKYAINDFLAILGNVLALIIIYILTKTTTGNLLYVVMAFTITPVVIYILASIPIFRKYSKLRPSFYYFDKKLIKQVVEKGLGFFFIQITSCLIIYGSSNLFITQFCGPSAVTTYNIAYKYFNLIAIAYTIVISPIWNAYTDAYVKGDIIWINKTFIRTLKFWGLSVVGGFIMLLFCNIFYKMWVGDSVKVPLTMSLFVLAYITSFNFNCCVTCLINGLNKIHVQIITSVVFTALYLLLVFFFGRKYGVNGIVLSMTVSYFIMGLIHLYQCKLLIGQKATGIWNK